MTTDKVARRTPRKDAVVIVLAIFGALSLLGWWWPWAPFVLSLAAMLVLVLYVLSLVVSDMLDKKESRR